MKLGMPSAPKKISQQQVDKRQAGSNTSHALPNNPWSGGATLNGATSGKNNSHPLHKGLATQPPPKFKDSGY